MPLPTPRSGESRNDFISRCISQTQGEFNDNAQRAAVCNSQWDKKQKNLAIKGLDAVKDMMKAWWGKNGKRHVPNAYPWNKKRRRR